MMKKNSLKKINILTSVSLMGLLAVGCGAKTTDTVQPNAKSTNGGESSGQKQGKVVMRVGFGPNEQSNGYKALLKFKDLVNQYSNQTVEVQIFPGNQLGADLSMLQQMQSGALESAVSSTSPIANITPELSLYDLPFLFKDEKVVDKVLQGPVGQKMLDLLPAQGLLGLTYWENGFRDFTNSKRPVKTLEDLKGMKMRVMQTPVHIDFWKELGANPTPMSFDQVFNALQQHVVDAEENPVQTISFQKYYEVQKYMTITHHVYTPFIFLVSKTWWGRLSKDQQDAIQKASVEAGQYQRSLNREEAAQDIEDLKKHGMEIDTLTDEERNKMKDKVAPVIAKYTSKYTDLAKTLFDAIKQAESN